MPEKIWIVKYIGYLCIDIRYIGVRYIRVRYMEPVKLQELWETL